MQPFRRRTPSTTFESVQSSQRHNTDFYRLFMVPGMSQCGDGLSANVFGDQLAVPDPDAAHDVVMALDQCAWPMLRRIKSSPLASSTAVSDTAHWESRIYLHSALWSNCSSSGVSRTCESHIEDPGDLDANWNLRPRQYQRAELRDAVA
jgi:hypothetical protein